MSLAPLRIAAARYVLQVADHEELRRAADEALTRGVYSYSLGELGTTTEPTYWVVRPLFEASMKELGIALPSASEAAERLASHHLRRFIEGGATPYQTVRALREVDDPWTGPAVRDSFSAEDRDRLARLVGCYYRYDYTAEYGRPEHLDALHQEIRRIALDWVAARGRGRLDQRWLAWNDGSISKMAQAIRAGQRFADLPLLADALEEAGCCDVDILEHCREQAAHVTDCWVVHLLLADP